MSVFNNFAVTAQFIVWFIFLWITNPLLYINNYALHMIGSTDAICVDDLAHYSLWARLTP